MNNIYRDVFKFASKIYFFKQKWFTSGNYTLKLLSRQEKGFGGIGTITGDNKIVTSLVWISADVLIAGTNDGLLHFIEGGDPKCIYDALTTDEIDLSKIKEG